MSVSLGDKKAGNASESRGCYFALNGIGGMLIAVVLLLSIVGVLSVLGLLTQQSSANNPYVVTGGAVANPQTKEDVFANLKGVKIYDDGANNNAFVNKK